MKALRRDLAEHMRPNLFGIHAVAHLDILERRELVLPLERAVLVWSHCEMAVDFNFDSCSTFMVVETFRFYTSIINVGFATAFTVVKGRPFYSSGTSRVKALSLG